LLFVASHEIASGEGGIGSCHVFRVHQTRAHV